MTIDMNQVLKEMVATAEKHKAVRFIAYINQGEGCDYMISCGETLWKLEAFHWDEAIREVKEKTTGEDGYFGEYELDTIEIFEIMNSKKMPVSNWYSEIEESKKAKKAKEKEYADKVEYERLKLRFG